MKQLPPGCELDPGSLRIPNTPARAPIVVQRELAQGPHGAWYLARLGERDLLISLLDPAFASVPGILSQLESDLARAQTVHHRSLLAGHGMARHGSTAYTVWDDPDGRPLRAHIQRQLARGKPIDLQTAATLVGHLCRALANLHRVMPHGFVCADSVFVARKGRVLLGESGMGRALLFAPARERFRKGGLLPQAPEQVDVNPRLLPQSDVLALAALFVEILTGESILGAGADLSGLATRAPPSVVSVVRQALDPDPARRPADPLALRAALHQALHDPAAALRVPAPPLSGGRNGAPPMVGGAAQPAASAMGPPAGEVGGWGTPGGAPAFAPRAPQGPSPSGAASPSAAAPAAPAFAPQGPPPVGAASPSAAAAPDAPAFAPGGFHSPPAPPGQGPPPLGVTRGPPPPPVGPPGPPPPPPAGVSDLARALDPDSGLMSLATLDGAEEEPARPAPEGSQMIAASKPSEASGASPAQAQAASAYVLVRGGVDHGPYPLEDLREMIWDGRVRSVDTLRPYPTGAELLAVDVPDLREVCQRVLRKTEHTQAPHEDRPGPPQPAARAWLGTLALVAGTLAAFGAVGWWLWQRNLSGGG